MPTNIFTHWRHGKIINKTVIVTKNRAMISERRISLWGIFLILRLRWGYTENFNGWKKFSWGYNPQFPCNIYSVCFSTYHSKYSANQFWRNEYNMFRFFTAYTGFFTLLTCLLSIANWNVKLSSCHRYR